MIKRLDKLADNFWLILFVESISIIPIFGYSNYWTYILLFFAGLFTYFAFKTSKLNK